MWELSLKLLKDAMKKNTLWLTGKPRALWKIHDVSPQITKEERGAEKTFNCSWVSSDLEISHYHVKFHWKSKPSRCGCVWKKCRPLIWTVEDEAFKVKTDASQSCHGSGARSAGSPWVCVSKAWRNTFQSHFCLQFVFRHQFTIHII